MNIPSGYSNPLITKPTDTNYDWYAVAAFVIGKVWMVTTLGSLASIVINNPEGALNNATVRVTWIGKHKN